MDKMPHDDKVFLVTISNNLILKYDGIRDKDKWTLLRKGGGKIFDGTIEEVVAYLNNQTRVCVNCFTPVLDFITKQTGWEQIGTMYNPCWQPTYEHKCMECV